MVKNILITGATSGIGLATADKLLNEGHHVIACGRNTEKLTALKNNFSELEILKFDVADPNQVNHTLDKIKESVDVLINNAGNAHGLDHIQDGDPDDWDRMIDSNIRGLLYVTRAILPEMVKRERGEIINISSISGKEAYAKGTVYCATKFAVDAITMGMKLDLNEHGIKVTSINPGAVNTNFSKVRFKGDQQKADQVYEGFKPLSGNDIAEIISFVISLPPHVNISDLTILPTAQANTSVIDRSGKF